jgi:SAM-dependent methyltransferase
MWARLTEIRLLGQGRRVVELGAGTGQATGPMIGAGASVVAVEPGREMAARLRSRCPSATVLVESAESVLLPDAAFDLAVSATAVHWFDLDVVLPKLHRALTPEGAFAVWWNGYGDPKAPVSPFRERVAAITARRVAAVASIGPDHLDTAGWTARIEATGHFKAFHVEEFRWLIEMGTEEIRGLFTTFSNWDAAEVNEAAAAVEALGGRVTEHYVTPLIAFRPR